MYEWNGKVERGAPLLPNCFTKAVINLKLFFWHDKNSCNFQWRLFISARSFKYQSMQFFGFFSNLKVKKAILKEKFWTHYMYIQKWTKMFASRRAIFRHSGANITKVAPIPSQFLYNAKYVEQYFCIILKRKVLNPVLARDTILLKLNKKSYCRCFQENNVFILNSVTITLPHEINMHICITLLLENFLK